MRDQFLPGRHLPPGTWPFSIQDLLQAALQPAVPPMDAGTQGAVASAKPPSGGLFGILAGQNAPWDRGTSGPSSTATPSASGGLLGSLGRPDSWSSGTPHWLQTALPFGLDLGPFLPGSGPPPQAPAPFGLTSPTLPNLPAPSLTDLDASGPYWLQTAVPLGANGGSLPLSMPPANAAPDTSLQQALAAMWDPATLPIPPALPPVFPTAPPNGSWNAGSPSLWDILAGSDAELPTPPATGDLASDATPRIPAAPLTPVAPEDSSHFYDATTAALAQPGGAAAAASPAEPLGRSQTWPALSPRYPGDAVWTRGVETQSDPRILSDATPDNNWTPGARYASNSNNRGRPSGLVRLGEGRWVEPQGEQAVRLTVAEARARNAIARVRELDPSWRPQPTAYESVEGLIRAYQSEAAQAQARLRELARQQFSPLIPAESRRPGQRWSDTAREIAHWLVKNRGHVVEGVSWLFEVEPSIEAYLDPPKTLEELQRAVFNPKKGYEIHHIVEKKSAERDHFPSSMIHGPDNLVRIPQFKHWEINSWYMTPNEDTQGLPPRDYLRKKPWDERTRIGIRALIRHGVLKP